MARSGGVPHSALKIREAYAEFDAERRFNLPLPGIRSPSPASAARSSGARRPARCPLFGRGCTPPHPIGAWSRPKGACARALDVRPPRRQRKTKNTNQGDDQVIKHQDRPRRDDAGSGSPRHGGTHPLDLCEALLEQVARSAPRQRGAPAHHESVAVSCDAHVVKPSSSQGATSAASRWRGR